MRTHWLAFTVLILLLQGLPRDAQGQPRPRPGTSRDGFHSRFGPRSLGFPVNSRPRVSADYGVFGPRANFRRGFSAPRSYSVWDGLPPETASRFSADSVLGRPAGQGVQAAGEPRPAIEPPGELGARTAQDVGQAEREITPGPVPGEAAPQPGFPPADAAELGLQSSPPQARAEGIAPGPARPRFEWSAESIRALPAESILADRLRAVLRSRLRSPLEVTIREETAILRGVVASPRDRLLAGHLARFEPGVYEVTNELTVAASPPEKRN